MNTAGREREREREREGERVREREREREKKTIIIKRCENIIMIMRARGGSGRWCM